MEFKEKMAAKKKKPRPKRKQKEKNSPTKYSSVTELSLKLQDLALSSSSVVTTSTVEEAEQEKEQQKNSKKHDYVCLIDSPARENCNNAWSTTMDRFGVGSSSCSLQQETEVIDLISPCPEARSRSVSRSYQEQKSHDHQLETVIELSDSETDDEEHCKKARELRIFLENIRKDTIL